LQLTFLLQPSLAGNCKTLMFCNIAPEEEQVEESLRSLHFALRVNSCAAGRPGGA
jgi:kinesin family protein C1